MRPIDNQDFSSNPSRMDLSTQQTHAHEVWEPTDNQNLGNSCPTPSLQGEGLEGPTWAFNQTSGSSQFSPGGSLLDLMSPEEKLAFKNMEISSNTTSDRSKIDFGSKQYTIAINYSNDDWDWGKNCTVIHDEKYDFAYSTSDTNMKQAFIGSINEYMDPLEEGKYYFFEITNNTDKELNATPVDRGWGSSSDSVVIPIGESKIVSAPWTTWNANATKKGPCVRLDSTAGENFAGNITFSTLQILNENPGYYSKVALVPSWDYLDANVSYVGGTFAINTSLAFTEASSEVFFESKDTTTELANGKYYMVQVTNDTNAVLAVKMVGREWGGTAGDTFTVSIGETAIVYASSTTWNSQTKKGVAVRFAPSAGGTFYGTLTVSNPVIVDAIPAPTLFNRLDAQDSDWHSVPVNLTYDNQYGYCYSFNGANVAHLYLMLNKPKNIGLGLLIS